MTDPPGSVLDQQWSEWRRVERQLIASRIPVFIATWSAALVLWLAVYAFESRLAPMPALVVVVAHVLIFGGAALVAWPGRIVTWVREAAVGAVILVGLTTAIGFAAMGGPADVIAYAMLTLYLMSALVFAWGWRAELAVYGSTIGPVLLIFATRGLMVSIPLMGAAILVGTTTALLVAELARRNFEAEFARRSSDAHFRSSFDHAPVGMLIVRPDGHLVRVNRAFCEMLGYAHDALAAKSVIALTHPDDLASTAGGMQRLIDGETESLEQEKRYLHKDGSIIFGHVTASLVRDRAGAPLHFVAQVQDVGERRRREAALLESEARYRGLVESQTDLVARSDVRGRLTFANDAYRRTFGLEQAAIDRREVAFFTLVHPDDLPSVLESVHVLRNPPHRNALVNRARTPGGWRWFEWETCGIVDERGETVEFQAAGRDVTARRAADEQLQQSLVQLRRNEEKLRALALRQVSIRDAERKRLGLDLHDDVCQELVGIGILVASLRRRLGPMSTENAATFDRIVDYANQLVEHLRVLARDLQPLQLHDYGLADGLRSLADGMSSETLRVEAVLPPVIPRLDERTEVTTYRFAQEALNNAVRHSDGSVVQLIVTVADGLLRLVVSDDGRGFDPDRCPDALGIVSMEERVMALGGRFTLESAPGEGTLVMMECAIAVAERGGPSRAAGAR